MSNDEPKLPALVEGVLSLFEGFKGPAITFRHVVDARDRNCMYCTETTSYVLEVVRGEVLIENHLCLKCKDAIGMAVG